MTTVTLATHTPPDKSQLREVFNANMRAAFAYEATLAPQINTVAGEINANAQLAAEKADVAVSAAEDAGNAAENTVDAVLDLLDASTTLATEKANEADIAASIAIASANFAGAWSGLSGALSPPKSVVHNSVYWTLLNDITDVASSEPGDSEDWAKISFLPLADLEILAQIQATALSF